jgi:hypothetical protein
MRSIRLKLPVLTSDSNSPLYKLSRSFVIIAVAAGRV